MRPHDTATLFLALRDPELDIRQEVQIEIVIDRAGRWKDEVHKILCDQEGTLEELSIRYQMASMQQSGEYLAAGQEFELKAKKEGK